jgi:hypothetical protein
MINKQLRRFEFSVIHDMDVPLYGFIEESIVLLPSLSLLDHSSITSILLSECKICCEEFSIELLSCCR